MRNAATIRELVQISRDGLEFYQHAMSEVKSEELKSFFARMAGHKRTLIAALSSNLATQGEDVPSDGTVAGLLRKGYADVRAMLSTDEEAVYISQLEEAEDRLLKHYQDALENADEPALRSVLERHYAQVRSCHDEMRALKQRRVA